MILAIVMSIVKWAHIISQNFVADTYFKLVALLLVACFLFWFPFYSAISKLKDYYKKCAFYMLEKHVR